MNGIYGTVKPANIDVTTDVEMFYCYKPNRSSSEGEYGTFKSLSTSCLEPVKCENEYSITTDILGLYNLKLPFDIFNMKGFYTIYIRPKENIITIHDTGVLTIDNSIKGIVLNTSETPEMDLTGYRIEYFDSDDKRNDVVRLITSCNPCQANGQGLSTTQSRANSYTLLNQTSSNLVFCTVTPSTSPSFKANSAPFIGEKNGKICLINTKFNPIMIELEMTEHDDDTISYMLESDQIRDRDKSIITTYTDENEIYHQYDYYTVKDSLGNSLYDVKTKRTDIDGSQEHNNIVTE